MYSNLETLLAVAEKLPMARDGEELIFELPSHITYMGKKIEIDIALSIVMDVLLSKGYASVGSETIQQGLKLTVRFDPDLAFLNEPG